MTELPDIKVLQKFTNEELAEVGLKRDKHGKIRNLKGHYIPGQSGRVPTGKLTPKNKAKAQLAKVSTSDIIPDEIRAKYGDNPLRCLQEMLKLAKTKSEAMKICKELLPYTFPKLAAVEQKTFNFHAGNIEVEWVGDSGKYEKPRIDNEPSDT